MFSSSSCSVLSTMSVSNGEPSSSITYKKISKSNCDSEVLIETNIISSVTSSKANHVSFGTRLFLMFVIFFTVVALFTLAINYWSREYDSNSCYVEPIDLDCAPLNSVHKIVINISDQANYSCFDGKSCMEKDQYGLKYNFIIGSDFPTYEPLKTGFHCLINGYTDTLYLKIIRQNQSVESFLEDVCRTVEVIQEGLKTGKISSNFTVSQDTEELSQVDPDHHVEFHTNSEIRSFRPKHKYFLDYSAKIKAIFSKDLNASVCHSNFQFDGLKHVHTHTTVKNSSGKCFKYKPADIVIVSVDEATQNISFSAQIDCLLFEDRNYNFVFKNYHNFMMLGFKCGTKFNILKVKKRKPDHRINYLYVKNTGNDIFEFLKKAMNCGQISQNFTFIIKCEDNCQKLQCSNDTLMNWHNAFHEFKTTQSKWLKNETDCIFPKISYVEEASEENDKLHFPEAEGHHDVIQTLSPFEKQNLTSPDQLATPRYDLEEEFSEYMSYDDNQNYTSYF